VQVVVPNDLHLPTISIYCKTIINGLQLHSRNLDLRQSHQLDKLIGKIHNKCILSYQYRNALFF